MTDNPFQAGELVAETWPPSRYGGQHVGAVSGVRVTHVETGTQAFVNIARSQHTNKQIAVDMILTALTHPKF